MLTEIIGVLGAGGLISWLYRRRPERDGLVASGARDAVEAMAKSLDRVEVELDHARATISELQLELARARTELAILRAATEPAA
jgi:hypothetical protein